MALSVALKVVGIIVALGLPSTAIYYGTKSLVSMYEVENKVMENSVYLTINDPSTSEDTASVKIEVNASSDNDTWKNGGDYSWSCTITGNPEFVSKDNLSKKFPTSSSHKDKKIRQINKLLLIYFCSWGRESSSTQQKVTANLSWIESFFENDREEVTE